MLEVPPPPPSPSPEGEEHKQRKAQPRGRGYTSRRGGGAGGGGVAGQSLRDGINGGECNACDPLRRCTSTRGTTLSPTAAVGVNLEPRLRVPPLSHSMEKGGAASPSPSRARSSSLSSHWPRRHPPPPAFRLRAPPPRQPPSSPAEPPPRPRPTHTPGTHGSERRCLGLSPETITRGTVRVSFRL